MALGPFSFPRGVERPRREKILRKGLFAFTCNDPGNRGCFHLGSNHRRTKPSVRTRTRDARSLASHKEASGDRTRIERPSKKTSCLINNCPASIRILNCELGAGDTSKVERLDVSFTKIRGRNDNTVYPSVLPCIKLGPFAR